MAAEQILRFKIQGASSLDYLVMAIRKDGNVRLLCNCQTARQGHSAGCSHRVELLSGELKSVLPGSDDLGKLAALLHGTELEKAYQRWVALEHARVIATSTARGAKESLYFAMDFDPDEKAAYEYKTVVQTVVGPMTMTTKSSVPLRGEDDDGKH